MFIPIISTTPRVIVNQSNPPVWCWDKTHAFGTNLSSEDPDGNGQLFEYHPSYPGSTSSRMHYNYFHYYETETGRYISPDPIGLMGESMFEDMWGRIR